MVMTASIRAIPLESSLCITAAVSRDLLVQMINYILLVSRQGSLLGSILLRNPLNVYHLQERFVSQNGSARCRQRPRPRLSKISLSSSSLVGRGCVIF